MQETAFSSVARVGARWIGAQAFRNHAGGPRRDPQKFFELDQNVVEEQAAGTDLFFVLRGRAKIIKQGGGGEEQVHEEIGLGRIFGERALVTKDSRSATVRVMASSRSLASEK